ncbi:MAG: NAD-dependent epimerase [Syntrophaceae bacterium]
MHCLVTGAAGFIGFTLSRRLLEEGHTVVGLDNLNDYYDPRLKQARLSLLEPYAGFTFERLDLIEKDRILNLIRDCGFDVVIHLAAQAGVRYSLENPHAYVDANLVGFMHILEGCRQAHIQHLVYASSSSVYGSNSSMPFSVHDNVDHPVSLYAATKKANELMAHCYASLYGLPCTGLRFFTVYGPWGRPDMALFKFTHAILNGQPIELYNHGRMQRDFTYVDDIIEGLVRIMNIVPRPDPEWDNRHPDPGTSSAPYRIYNIGGSHPVELSYFVEVLEQAIGVKAMKEMLPLQPGDVVATCADARDLETITGFRPQVPIEVGIARFVDWYRTYYC